MCKKKFVFTITLVIFLVSALSVFSIVKDFSILEANPSKNKVGSAKKTSTTELDTGCSAQGGICPPAWNSKETIIDSSINNKKNINKEI